MANFTWLADKLRDLLFNEEDFRSQIFRILLNYEKRLEKKEKLGIYIYFLAIK